MTLKTKKGVKLKINLTIFKKEFLGVEVESDPKLFTGLDLDKPN